MRWLSSNRLTSWLRDNWVPVLIVLVWGTVISLGLWGASRQPQSPVTCAMYAFDSNRAERVCICWSNEACARKR